MINDECQHSSYITKCFSGWQPPQSGGCARAVIRWEITGSIPGSAQEPSADPGEAAAKQTFTAHVEKDDHAPRWVAPRWCVVGRTSADNCRASVWSVHALNAQPSRNDRPSVLGRRQTDVGDRIRQVSAAANCF